MRLVKHSSVEFGRKWWFLYEVRNHRLTLEDAAEAGLDALKYTRSVRFVKRFGSEEELELEAAIKYGAAPVDLSAVPYPRKRPV